MTIQKYCTSFKRDPICYKGIRVDIDSEETVEAFSLRINKCLMSEIPHAIVHYGCVGQKYEYRPYPIGVGDFFFEANPIENVKPLRRFNSYITPAVLLINAPQVEDAIIQIRKKRFTLEAELVQKGLSQTVVKLIGSYFTFFLSEEPRCECCVLL